MVSEDVLGRTSRSCVAAPWWWPAWRAAPAGLRLRIAGNLAEHGFPVDANTLYPLLRRLEEQGLLPSEWNTEESRPRKFYRTSDEGESMLTRLLDDLAAVQTSITGLIQGADR